MFKNSYTGLPERFYARVKPESFKSPSLMMFNRELADDLNSELNKLSDDELAMIFSGQEFLEGSDPIAQAYAGFQFGHPNPQLGDGRAHLLGQIAGQDIQLKGSGRTPFSRRGDGRSALGPVIREYIVSEAMNALGIPTTRALAAVRTGEHVLRQFGKEPGGVFTRVANSHLRVGTFQYFSMREDFEGLEKLLDYTIKLHYPHLENDSDKALKLLIELTKKQSELIAHWTSVGFIHGVMNTDNFSVAGITIDFGPCAFLDEFNYNKVFSSIDERGRYSFFNQLPIAQWNLLRFADTLLPFIHSDQEKAIKMVQESLTPEFDSMETNRWIYLAKKIGITNYTDADQVLIQSFLDYLEKEKLDFTLSFRNLPELYNNQSNFYPETAELIQFKEQWKNRVTDVSELNSINPLYIPRNHQIKLAIDESYEGNNERFFQLVELLKNPYMTNEKLDHFKIPPMIGERVKQTFCGT